MTLRETIGFSIYFGVPGYKYDLKPYFELEEGLAILGL